MWLNAASSNNNPRYIANFYVKCIQEIGGKYHASIVSLITYMTVCVQNYNYAFKEKNSVPPSGI